MKILVCSDSHGFLGTMVDAMEREQPHRVFFLGDHDRDGMELAALYPDTPMDLVRGNCDWGSGADLKVIELENVRFLLTHGHMQCVKSGLDHLLEVAQNHQAQVVCFGHTHQACVERREGVYFMNPGTAGGCRAPAGYGMIYVRDGAVEFDLKN